MVVVAVVMVTGTVAVVTWMPTGTAVPVELLMPSVPPVAPAAPAPVPVLEVPSNCWAACLMREPASWGVAPVPATPVPAAGRRGLWKSRHGKHFGVLQMCTVQGQESGLVGEGEEQVHAGQCRTLCCMGQYDFRAGQSNIKQRNCEPFVAAGSLGLYLWHRERWWWWWRQAWPAWQRLPAAQQQSRPLNQSSRERHEMHQLSPKGHVPFTKTNSCLLQAAQKGHSPSTSTLE